MIRVGLISDTHGLLRPQARAFLAGCDHIVLFVNPGSAGPRRFKLPVALGELTIDVDSVTARMVNITDHNAA